MGILLLKFFIHFIQCINIQMFMPINLLRVTYTFTSSFYVWFIYRCIFFKKKKKSPVRHYYCKLSIQCHTIAGITWVANKIIQRNSNEQLPPKNAQKEKQLTYTSVHVLTCLFTPTFHSLVLSKLCEHYWPAVWIVKFFPNISFENSPFSPLIFITLGSMLLIDLKILLKLMIPLGLKYKQRDLFVVLFFLFSPLLSSPPSLSHKGEEFFFQETSMKRK